MLYQKILLFEQQIKSQKSLMKNKTKVLEGIKSLLSRLDLKAETPGGSEIEKICDLLEELKEGPLTEAERELVSEIIEVECNGNCND